MAAMTREEMVIALQDTQQAKEAHKLLAAKGAMPRFVAKLHSKVIREQIASGDIRYDPADAARMAALLDAGEFDQEIAAFLGYT